MRKLALWALLLSIFFAGSGILKVLTSTEVPVIRFISAVSFGVMACALLATARSEK